ncbi:tail fiber domain-containing protein [Sphingobium yanoikuyae]|uniref:Tail fiber domain-containing protein n=1 Tax=Sphingobium yanoikuyae TaxID=13690 RepID=A0A3G2UMZ5_SPHYA|nr:tail fiber domain-containing protein [Sphingobium yanoikuyae]AYO76426.1 tail fiber domain-containing protein [Sphingobium yanoikuyae]
MSSKGSSPSPDPQIGRAAIMQAELGKEFLNFSKEQYATQNARNDKLDDLSTRVANAQLDASTQAQEWASEDRDRYKSVFQPLQDEFIAEANKYGSEAYQDQAASKARADVINAATGQAQQRQRQMASMGISPTSGRYAGIERASDVQVSLGAAGAENNARQLARDKGLALKADSINLGNGLPSSAAGSLGLGVTAGSSAVSTSTVPISTANQSLGVLQGGYGTAMNGYAGQANTLNSLYQNQLSAWQAQQQASGGIFNTLGTVAGAAIMASSKDYKTEKKPARGVLEAVRKMPVEEWTYRPGIADEGRHIGPYAEDFQAATGKGDGKSIPVVDAIGVTLGAIRELDDKVSKLERGVIRKDGRKAA